MILKGQEKIMGAGDEVSKYFNLEFWEWQAGERRTQVEFAEYLGVAPGTLGHWMNGIRKPDYENCERLSKKMGNSVFIVSGYLPSDPELREIVYAWGELNEEARNAIAVVVENRGKRKELSVSSNKRAASRSKVAASSERVEPSE